MTQVKYIGPFDEVEFYDAPDDAIELDGYARSCRHGSTVEVSPAVAKRLVEQTTNWEVVNKPGKSTSKD